MATKRRRTGERTVAPTAAVASKDAVDETVRDIAGQHTIDEPQAPPTEETLLPLSFYDRPAPVVARALLGKLLHHRIPRPSLSSPSTSSPTSAHDLAGDGTGDGTEGCVSVWGRIVETEAYDADDPASHSYKLRRTTRNMSMFDTVASAYVYKSYGIHHCLNVTCGAPGAAVLIRAVEPLGGLAHMARLRGLDTIPLGSASDLAEVEGTQASTQSTPIATATNTAATAAAGSITEVTKRKLCKGPGNLAKAFNLSLLDDGVSLQTTDFGIHMPSTGTSSSNGVADDGLAIDLGRLAAATVTDIADADATGEYSASLNPDESVASGPRIGISVGTTVPWRFYITPCDYVSGPKIVRPRPRTATDTAGTAKTHGAGDRKLKENGGGDGGDGGDRKKRRRSIVTKDTFIESSDGTTGPASATPKVGQGERIGRRRSTRITSRYF